jgi:surface carbohydrate biosynthesis protein (TIGR04326 family)
VEEQASSLRSRFLGWVYDLGEAEVGGARLVDRLALRPTFSYWWMTLLVEKSHDKSARLIDAVKLLALEDLAQIHSAGRMILASGDKTLASAFRLWCSNAGFEFQLHRLSTAAVALKPARRLLRSLPQPVQALISLSNYLWRRWPLRGAGRFPSTSDKGKVTILDYLFHLTKEALTTGRFGSNYWTHLVDALERDAVRVNWLHQYVGQGVVSSARQAVDLVARFNRNSPGTQLHSTLDHALGWRVVKKTVRDYSRLALIGLRLSEVRRHFRPAGSCVDLWPLFKEDWYDSIFGKTAVSNLLHLNLLERDLAQFPHQELGLYLQENQSWEMALIYAWKAAGHGHLIGVPHTCVNFWDLRFFFDVRAYRRTGKNDLPLPDTVALNGPAALTAYRKGGYPEHGIREVEALRFLYIADFPPLRRVTIAAPRGSLRVLVLGDYSPSVSRRQMQWLSEAAHSLPPETQYVVKPHPACPIKAADLPALKTRITDAPLAELLRDCDVAYTSNVTSAAVDAYSAGIHVVSVLDGDAFNVNPLRGMRGVTYVTGPHELARALCDRAEIDSVSTDAYFCIDKQLPRWRQLLGLSVSCVA